VHALVDEHRLDLVAIHLGWQRLDALTLAVGARRRGQLGAGQGLRLRAEARDLEGPAGLAAVDLFRKGAGLNGSLLGSS